MEDTEKNGKFITFEDNQGDLIHWGYLKITAERLK